MSPSYVDLLAAVAESQRALEATLDSLTEDQARGPSLLPGWTRGHVATHLARNADAQNRFALGVTSGTPAPMMYPGGPDARAAAIEEGADRPVALLAADLRFAGRRAIESMRAITPEMYATPITWRKPVTAQDIPVLRWRELEIHHVDLGVGYTAADWPELFVEHTLATELPELASLHPEIPIPDLPQAELLAWLIGRPTRAGLPEVPAWPF